MGILTLCDIKGPLIFHGLPPFVLTGSALLLTVTAFTIMWRRSRLSGIKRALEITPPAAPADTLTQISNDYHHGLISTDTLFNRLADVLCAGLPGQTGSVRHTRAETLDRAAATGSISDENLLIASCLLLLCEQIKFARYQPSTCEITGALESAAVLLAATSGDMS
jgi:hypothetical protein